MNTANVSCSPQGFTNTLTASDSVTVNVTPSAQALAVSKTGPDYAKVGDAVTYTIKIINISTVDVTVTSISDTLLGNLLATAKTACSDPLLLTAGNFCEFTYARTVLAGDSDPLPNVVTVQGEGPFGGQAGPVSDDHSVDLVHPSYTVTKDCLTDPVPQGQSATFRIRIQNTGDVNLLTDISDPLININLVDVLIPPFAGNPVACTDTDFVNGTPGCYETTGSVVATGTSVQNTVQVHATLPPSFNLSNAIDHSAGGACQVTGGATRTWGFWKTHGSDGQKFLSPVEYGYTCHVFEDHLGSSVNLGWKVLTNCEQVFGLFWADPAKDPATGKNRDQTCKTGLHASQQLLAAILNSALTNGATPPAGLINSAIAALSACADNNATTTCNRNLLTNLAGQLAAYNESGDTVAIVDQDGATIPHADPRGMRDVADYSIGSCPKP